MVIADTGPINYLILIGHIDVLPELFQRVIVPAVVCNELRHPKAPALVRDWIATPPPWTQVHQLAHFHDVSMDALDAGEEDAIALAMEIRADMILMDDRDGAIVARERGFRVAGTLGILAMAAARNLVHLADSFDRIKRTNFHYQQEIMDQLLADAARNK